MWDRPVVDVAPVAGPRTGAPPPFAICEGLQTAARRKPTSRRGLVTFERAGAEDGRRGDGGGGGAADDCTARAPHGLARDDEEEEQANDHRGDVKRGRPRGLFDYDFELLDGLRILP